MSSALVASYLDGMARMACTVSIVTTDGTAGRFGVTVSAVSSVSAGQPHPILVACVHHLSPAALPIRENGVMCVNVLRSDQMLIADTFAGRCKDRFADKFDCADWQALSTGAPVLMDGLVAFDCRVLDAQRWDSHFVFHGEVIETSLGPAGAALVYANRRYSMPAQL